MTDATSQPPAHAQSANLVALPAGQMVGRYEITSILGQGGFGITYRARDTRLNRDVALKEYLPMALVVRQDGVTVLPRSTEVAADFTWGRDRFITEGQTLASLHQAPAIVRVFDFLEANGTAYIVMELLSGDTLESRLKDKGPLSPAEVEAILWPMLDGLEQVHDAGFLHRDIKPANILLNAEGKPTLIDFGASRAAMAGRPTAMTAIFTPGYAAAEQFTSSKQGPWTDIYALAAALYTGITGRTPPSAFDRMLDDEYEPLARLASAGFSSGLLVGIDAGLAAKAADRPQSIADWRAVLGQSSAPAAEAAMRLARQSDAAATILMSRSGQIATPQAAARRRIGFWAGMAVVLLLALAGGGYWFATRPPAVDVAAQLKAAAEAKAQQAEAAKLKQQQEELERLRAEKAKRDQEAHDTEIKRKAEEEAYQKFATEQAAREKAEADAKAKAAAEEAERQRALEHDKARAMEVEAGLHLGALDRQHMQVALTALGFITNGTDGVFSQRTHDMISAWQKSHSYPETGYLTGPQSQELLKAASAAIAKFDGDQKKAADEAKAKADADKAKQAAAATQPAALAPTVAIVPRGPGPDGLWQGVFRCSAAKHFGEDLHSLRVVVSGGTGTWAVPGKGSGTTGDQAISLTITGTNVVVSRHYISSLEPGPVIRTQISARYDGKDTISGGGPEKFGGGRTCEISLTRSGP